MESRRNPLSWSSGIVVAAFCLALVPLAAAQENARLTADAFLYLSPDASRPPFAMVESGSVVTLLRSEGQWANIRIIDIEQKERYGYVEARYVRPWAAGTPHSSQRQQDVPGRVESIRSAGKTDTSGTGITSASTADSSPTSATRSTAAIERPLIRLENIRKIFIEKMPDDLDQYISAEITKELSGRLTVVLNRDSADAIMRGIGETHTGTGAAITGRYLGLHDNASGSISLVDRDETTVLWASEAGDRSLLFSVMRRGGQRKVADRLVNNLKKAISAK